MEGCLLFRFLLNQWIVALSLWKVVCCREFFIPLDGSLVIMEGCLLLRYLLFQWMVTLSLWKLIFYRDLYYSNGWYPCHYERYFVVEIFVTPMDDSLVIMEGSMLSISLLLQWMVALSLCKVICCRDFCYSNGW